eukprot:351257-Rhodomonas_salina.1
MKKKRKKKKKKTDEKGEHAGSAVVVGSRPQLARAQGPDFPFVPNIFLDFAYFFLRSGLGYTFPSTDSDYAATRLARRRLISRHVP